jgi:hypothetical protein
MKTQQRPPITDFDSVLDFCTCEIQAGRLTPSECLELYPDLVMRLQPLLKAAVTFTGVPRVTLRPEARDALEQRLRSRMAELPKPRNARSRRQPSLIVRWAAIATTVLLAIGVAGAGTVAAAAGSLPGDALYPIKRWSESVAVQFADERVQAQLHLEWAQRRLDEFQTLAVRGVVDVTLLDAVAAGMDTAIVASDVLDESSRVAALTRAADLHAVAIEVVSSVRDRAPVAALAGLDRALIALNDARDRALNRLPPPPTPNRPPTHTPQPTRTLTPTPTSRPTESATPTPPGQGTPGGGLTSTPPGQGTPGGGLTRTPPGQGTPGGGLTSTPPGQGTPGAGLTRTPPGQGTPGGGLTEQPPDQGPPGGGPPDTPPGQEPKPTKEPKP